MREEIKKFIEQHGYNAVLHELVFLAGTAITPVDVGFGMAYAAAAELSTFMRRLDMAESNRKERNKT